MKGRESLLYYFMVYIDAYIAVNNIQLKLNYTNLNKKK